MKKYSIITDDDLPINLVKKTMYYNAPTLGANQPWQPIKMNGNITISRYKKTRHNYCIKKINLKFKPDINRK